MTYDKEQILKLYSDEKNKTYVAQRYCKENNIEYSDNIRRKISTIINSESDEDIENVTDTDTNQYYTPTQLSAVKEDGSIMTIQEYCEYYKIPFDQVRTYKLVTHTAKGAYYNIASNTIKTERFEDFKVELIKQISDIGNKPKTFKRDRDSSEEKHLLVVDICDLHINKLSDSFETGEEYDSQIAVQRAKSGLEGILDKVKGFNIDQILFIGGNDILNIDNPRKMTTSGTPQDCDVQWFRGFLMAKELYIDLLNRLLEVANIHFVYNPSNHDFTNGFFLSDVIQTYFKDCENITFDCDLTHRKYYKYGENLIGSTHGDGAKLQDLPLLMAHESKDWSNCKHKYIYSHHLHHKVSKDFMGVCVESLRSPSNADGWHARNGYQHAPKAVEGFLHSKEYGQIARIVHLF